MQLTDLLDPTQDLGSAIGALADSAGSLLIYLVSGDLLTVHDVLASGAGWILVDHGFGEGAGTALIPFASIVRIGVQS